jgi:hypothetical protein
MRLYRVSRTEVTFSYPPMRPGHERCIIQSAALTGGSAIVSMLERSSLPDA